MLKVMFIKLILIMITYFSYHSQYTECNTFKYPDHWIGEQTFSHMTAETG